VDAIFLDIELLGTSGLSLARELEARPLPAIVFVTAFDEYAVPAFATEAVDYLTKPVEAQRLAKAIARIEAHEAAHRHQTANDAIRATLKPQHVTARVGAREEFIPFAHIECVEADGVYACVVQRERRVLVRYSMAALERLLPSGEFLRVHRSWIVRRALVRGVRAVGGGVHRELVLSNGLAVPVSRRRLPDILRQIRGNVP
ncbi:MAG: LytTR family DNA-binding domain-containing protein, partial [bacterium]